MFIVKMPSFKIMRQIAQKAGLRELLDSAPNRDFDNSVLVKTVNM